MGLYLFIYRIHFVDWLLVSDLMIRNFFLPSGSVTGDFIIIFSLFTLIVSLDFPSVEREKSLESKCVYILLLLYY